MKRLHLIILKTLVFAILPFASAPAATLMWDACTGEVDGYKVYYGMDSSALGQNLDVGNTTSCDLDAMPLQEEQTYFFSITAYNGAGESPPSSPVAYTVQDATPPAPPSGLKAR